MSIPGVNQPNGGTPGLALIGKRLHVREVVESVAVEVVSEHVNGFDSRFVVGVTEGRHAEAQDDTNLASDAVVAVVVGVGAGVVLADTWVDVILAEASDGCLNSGADLGK